VVDSGPLEVLQEHRRLGPLEFYVMSSDYYRKYMKAYNARPENKRKKRLWMRKRREHGIQHGLRWRMIVQKYLGAR
jgi:hypothetical protein